MRALGTALFLAFFLALNGLIFYLAWNEPPREGPAFSDDGSEDFRPSLEGFWP